MIFAYFLGKLPCGTALATLLRVDTGITLAVAISIQCTSRTLDPVYQRIRENPVGTAQRFQTAMEEKPDWKEKVEAILPGIRLQTYQFGGIGFICSIVLELIGALWAAYGV